MTAGKPAVTERVWFWPVAYCLIPFIPAGLIAVFLLTLWWAELLHGWLW